MATLQKTKKKQLMYFNIKSYHLPIITKYIYKSIAHRLTTDSKHIAIFNPAKTIYEAANKKDYTQNYSENCTID